MNKNAKRKQRAKRHHVKKSRAGNKPLEGCQEWNLDDGRVRVRKKRK